MREVERARPTSRRRRSVPYTIRNEADGELGSATLHPSRSMVGARPNDMNADSTSSEDEGPNTDARAALGAEKEDEAEESKRVQRSQGQACPQDDNGHQEYVGHRECRVTMLRPQRYGGSGRASARLKC